MATRQIRVDIAVNNGPRLIDFEIGFDDQITAGLNRIWMWFSILGTDIRQSAMPKVSLRKTRNLQEPIPQHELMSQHVNDVMGIFIDGGPTGITITFK